MDRDQLHRIYATWCAIKKTKHNVPAFAIFLEQEREKDCYKSNPKITWPNWAPEDGYEAEAN